MNLENYKQRFQTIAKQLPQHEDLQRSFNYFSLFILVRNIKYLYAAVTILENTERYLLTCEQNPFMMID